MVPFAGYEMPVQYPNGILAEHRHTRTLASNVSHMGQAILRGADAAAALETLIPGDIQGLDPDGMRYTQLTNDDGGILDDLMVTRRDDHLVLVVNASRKAEDFARIDDALAGRCALEVLEDRALIALQGPCASEILGALVPPAASMKFMSMAETDLSGIQAWISRSGYTGEDGYEISVADADAEPLLDRLLEDERVQPAGLGARDTLRLEAGLCLYGNDIDETTTPIEAGLAWSIGKRRRQEGGFPGAARIARQLAGGVDRRRVGLRPEDKAPARHGAAIEDEGGRHIGEVTSGGFGPTVEAPIAMGYVERAASDIGTAVGLVVRGTPRAARVSEMPFVAHRYFKG